MMVSAVGETARVKSGGGGGDATVSATVAEWLSVPEVPVKVSVALPGVVFAAALRVKFCADPGVRLSVAGCADTPVGSPEIATEIVPANAFVGEAVTLICCVVPPATRETTAGVEIKLKSPIGCIGCGLEPPPHESNARDARKGEYLNRVFERESITLRGWTRKLPG
jgi:hypothetical protein